MFDILAVGELLVDFTPVKNNGSECFQANPGGAPCNMLTMAQKLGSETAFIGKVGNDKFGVMLSEVLIKQGINTDGLIFSDEYPTTLAFVHLSGNGDRSFSFYRNQCADVMLMQDDINYTLIDNSKAIHFGSLSFTSEPSRSTVLKILEYSKNNGKIITYDPNYRALLWDSKEDAIKNMKMGLEYAAIVKVSDEEANLLTGEHDYAKASNIIHKYGVILVCITLGEEGTFYSFNGVGKQVNGFKSEVVDTTGAGDTFFGSLVHHILSSGKIIDEISLSEIEEYISLSNCAASLCIEGYGGIPSIPNKESILSRYKTKI